jgi:tetratricopeptide (TPR) repeat protein
MASSSGQVIAAPPPSSSASAQERRSGQRRVLVAEIRLSAALAALRSGTLLDLLHRYPHVLRRYVRWALGPVLATFGDALPAERRSAEAVALWLRWAAIQLRPDRGADWDAIDRTAWLDRTSWRPALALASYFGLVNVPDFRDRYRRRAGESAVENLCGLWAVGPSTFYRYVDKGKRQMALSLLDATRSNTVALRTFVHQQVFARRPFADPADRCGWHRAQAQQCVMQGDAVSMLWHCLQAEDHAAFIDGVKRYRAQIARRPELPELIGMLQSQALTPRQQFDLVLAQAALQKHRGEESNEQQSYERALRLASAANDARMLGEAYGVLGRFYEYRNSDRSFACYEDSARFLQSAAAGQGDATASQVTDSLVFTLSRLAWMYVSRNDPKSRVVLDQAQDLRERNGLTDETTAWLELTWGQYWRRAGELGRALEYMHRALNLFEKLDDQHLVLGVYINLSLMYAEVRDFDRALIYGKRVLADAGKVVLEPQALANTHGNLGFANALKGDYGAAIRHYEAVLDICRDTGLKKPVSMARYNLAELFYKRYQESRDPQDEQRGDAHVALLLRADPSTIDPAYLEITRKLKTEILGTGREMISDDRLLPAESAAHFDQMLRIQEHRNALALPSAPADQVRARLAIARAYAQISAREREAALALIHKHQLGEQFAGELAQLHNTFKRELTREQQVAAQWQTSAAEILQEERRIAVLEHLFHDGSIQKSVYARLCSVGLATASKHLTMLAERGLLVQSGRGPSTRYSLPQV